METYDFDPCNYIVIDWNKKTVHKVDTDVIEFIRDRWLQDLAWTVEVLQYSNFTKSYHRVVVNI